LGKKGDNQYTLDRGKKRANYSWGEKGEKKGKNYQLNNHLKEARIIYKKKEKGERKKVLFFTRV